MLWAATPMIGDHCFRSWCSRSVSIWMSDYLYLEIASEDKVANRAFDHLIYVLGWDELECERKYSVLGMDPTGD